MAQANAHLDSEIIGDLLATIEYDPEAIEARRLLAEQYALMGWMDAAAEEIQAILALRPDDEEAQEWWAGHILRSHSPRRESEEPRVARTAAWNQSSISEERQTVIGANLMDLENGYTRLTFKAAQLLRELHVFSGMCSSNELSGQMADIKAISEGRLSSVLKVLPPPSVRVVAKQIQNSKTAMDDAIADLESNARWLRTQGGIDISPDKLRDAMLKRAQAIKAVLPSRVTHIADLAFMHAQHEVLGKSYKNEGGQTMLGDAIASIPRASFWPSEDGYAWDMSELAQALSANQGVMRNPLSKEMFSADDVRAIVKHPMGKHLAALQLRQQQLTSGVRKDTIDRLEVMAKVLLADQSDDASSSRKAVDEFLSYAATLPEDEQKALHDLRVPAKDSHTGRAYDGSIGEAVADAKANKQCFHKTGDLLSQAATWLRAQATGKRSMPGA